MRRGDRGALVLAALAGLSAWITVGTLAVTSSSGERVGAVPSPWLAVTLVFVAVAVASVARLKTSESWPLALTATLWLPWVPVRIPAAFMVWEGPLEVLVWSAALFGVFLARVASNGSGRSRWFDPRLAPWLAGTLTLVWSLAAWAVLGDRLPDGDEPHYLIITQSLLGDGDLQIENNHIRGDYLAYHAEGLPPDYLRRGANEQIYSIHAPGLAVLLLPVFALAGYAGAVVLIAFLCAVGVALLWRSAFDLTSHAGAAWAASLAVACSAPFFLHSFTIFPDPVGAVIVAATVWLMVRLGELWRDFEAPPLSVAPWQIAVVGTALALLPWLHTRFALVAGVAAACVGLRLLGRSDRLQSLGGFVAAPVLSAVAWFSFFWIVYGTPNPAAPYGGSRQNAIAWMTNGATGLLFDQQFGLLSNAPVMLLVPFGYVLLARTWPRLTLELLAIAIPYAAVVTSFGMWWGGWSAPARFLVPILPLAAPALALAWVNGGAAVRSVFVALTLLGCANVVARVVMFDGALLYNQRNGYDLLLDWISRSVNLPLAMPAVHRTGALPAFVVGNIWILALLATVITLSVLFTKRVLGLGARWAVTGAVGLLAASIAVTASWRVAQAVALTPESSQVAFAARWNPERRPIAIEIPSVQRLALDSALGNLELRGSERSRISGSEAPLLEIARLPAGSYRVIIEGAPQLAGVLHVTVGSSPDVPLDQWPLANVSSGETALLIALPTRVHSLVVRGDAAARSRITRITLKPEIGSVNDRIDALAVRAAGYGRIRAFFLDERIYVEPSGMWIRGNAEADVLLAADADRWVDADVQAGPIRTLVELRSDDWSERLELSAGERRRIRIPTGRVVTIRTPDGFRPVDHDPAARDGRLLGVRLEFP